METLLTPRDVAGRLAVSMSTVRRLTDAGTLTSIKIGGQHRYRPEDLQRYIAEAAQ